LSNARAKREGGQFCRLKKAAKLIVTIATSLGLPWNLRKFNTPHIYVDQFCKIWWRLVQYLLKYLVGYIFATSSKKMHVTVPLYLWYYWT